LTAELAQAALAVGKCPRTIVSPARAKNVCGSNVKIWLRLKAAE